MKKLTLILLLILSLPLISSAQTCEDCPREARMSLGIVGGGSIASGAGPFTFVQSTLNADLDTIALTGVASGSLIVVGLKWEASDADASISDGTSSLVMGTRASLGGNSTSSQTGWLLVANSGNRTYTVTWPGGAGTKRIFIYEYSYSGTASLDVQHTGTGTSTTALTSDLTTTGTTEVCLVTGGTYSGKTYSDVQINDTAVDAGYITDTYAFSGRKTFTSTFTGHGQCTLSTSGGWAITLACFKTS